MLTKLVAKNDAPNSEPQLVQNTGKGDFYFKVQDEDEAEEVEVVVKQEHAMVVAA